MERFLLTVLNLVPDWVPEPLVRPIGVWYLKLVQRRLNRG